MGATKPGLQVVLGAPAPPGWVDGGHPLAPRVSWADRTVAHLRVEVSLDLFTQMQAELHRYRRWLAPEGKLELHLRAGPPATHAADDGPALVLLTSAPPPPTGLSPAWSELVVVVPASQGAAWRSLLGDDLRARVVIAAPNTSSVARLNLALALCAGDRIVLAEGTVPAEAPSERPARVVRVDPRVLVLERSALERLGALHPGFVSARRAFDDFALRAHAGGISTAVSRTALEGHVTPAEHLDAQRYTERWGIAPGTWPPSLRPPPETLAVPALPDPASTHEASPDGRTWRPRAA